MAPSEPLAAPTSARVLEALRGALSEDVSGELLARQLGMSRAAIWKAIARLRADGFHIEALRGRGYRLVNVPDRIRVETVEPWLHTERFGRRLLWKERTGSTMTDASARARAGDPEGTVVVAETQEQGRGRLGRVWHSPPGLNLYFSVLLRPTLPTHAMGAITLVAGLALTRAVARETGVEARIKWPNDLFIGPRKLAGILTELSAEMDRVHHVVVGVGINVNALPDDFPAELAGVATSLRIERRGEGVDRARFLAAFLDDLEGAYDRFLAHGLAPFVAELDALSAVRGHRVAVEAGSRRIEGIAGGVGIDGTLTLELEGGGRISLHSGEITKVWS